LRHHRRPAKLRHSKSFKEEIMIGYVTVGTNDISAFVMD
jgi:hypothetical protein